MHVLRDARQEATLGRSGQSAADGPGLCPRPRRRNRSVSPPYQSVIQSLPSETTSPSVEEKPCTGDWVLLLLSPGQAWRGVGVTVLRRGQGQGSGSWGGVEASERHRITQGFEDQKIVPPSKRFLCVFSLIKSPGTSSLAFVFPPKPAYWYLHCFAVNRSCCHGAFCQRALDKDFWKSMQQVVLSD